jgi:hypothetical protein
VKGVDEGSGWYGEGRYPEKTLGGSWGMKSASTSSSSPSEESSKARLFLLVAESWLEEELE